MQLSRRRFVGALGLVLSRPRFAAAETSADGFQILRAQKADAALLESDAIKSTTWRFTPDDKITVLRAKQGVELKVRLVNSLEDEIWFHWFGVRGPADLMTINVQPGESNQVDCVFTPPDAGTFWFGPFTDASRQRDMGLYGMLIVEETASAPALLDVPMIVDDWKIDEAGKLEENFGDLEAAVGAGRLGNWFTVNASYRPHIQIPKGKACRLRLLNAANVRTMSFQFKGIDPLVVALDGQPIAPRHSGLQPLSLAPGQRMDLVLDAGTENISIALDLFEDLVELCYLEREGEASAEILPDNFALPINPISSNLDMEKARVIAVVVSGGAKGGLKQAKFKGELLALRALLEKGMAWAINDVSGLGGEPFGTFAPGETIILDIDNRTSFEQPLHIHGHVWQLIEQNGEMREGQPWLDTAVVPASQKMKLGFVADNVGPWALQSLIAERVDAGLVASFVVAAPA